MDYDSLLRRFDAAKALRANFESLWQQIADRVLPQAADFTTVRAQGDRRTQMMYDATASLAARNAVAAIATFAWPSNQQYQKLTSDNAALNQRQDCKVWYDQLTETLFAARYSPRAAFEAQMGEAALQFFVFGTGVLFIDDNIRGTSLRYKALHLAQTYLLENDAGVIDTVFRRWSWSLRQIEQRFPGKLPEKYAKRLATHPDDCIDVVHAVMPRTDYEPGRLGAYGMPWASCYFLPEDKTQALEEGGYRTWPFMVMRYMTSPGEVYGRSPAWLALSDIKVLNAQKRSILQAAQMVAEPPLLLHEDGVLGAFSMAPGALNFGGLGDNGGELVKPLITGANVNIGIELMDKQREIISSAFLLDVFRALVDNPQMTATQALEIMKERATLLSPIIGRIESEGLGPGTEREIDLLGHAGQLPPPPEAVIMARGEYKIEYTSPARRAMRASDAIAITRTFEAVLPLASADPGVLDIFDIPEAAREVAEINGVPAKILRDAAAVAQLNAQRQQQQQVAAMVQAAPQVSAAANNLVKLQGNAGVPTL